MLSHRFYLKPQKSLCCIILCEGVLTMAIEEVLNVNQCSLILRCVIKVGIHSHHKSRSAPPGTKEEKQKDILQLNQCSAVESGKLPPLSLSHAVGKLTHIGTHCT